MKIINLSGVVGWDLTAKELKNELDNLNGESVRFDINSPGGSVFDGLEIFNLIKNYEGETETRLVSLGASMGSIIALAGDKKTAEDTAVYMIHNASGISWGDYREMEKTAELLKNISGHLANVYAKQTGVKKNEITDLMDNESWFFGDELKKFGFEMIETENEKDKETAQAVAKLDFQNCIEKMKNYKEPTEKISAMFQEQSKPTPQISAENKKNIQGAKSMDKTELMAKHPKLYAEIKADGAKETEKRIAELESYSDINSDVSAVIAKAKAEGKTLAQVMPDILKASQTTKEAIDAQADNAPEINASDSGEISDPESEIDSIIAKAMEVI